MPIQESITANVGGANAALDSVTQRMTKLEAATRRANAVAREQQKILSQQAQGRRGFLTQAGGAIGGAGSRVASSVAMGGGFAALSVGAIAVGVAFRQLGAVIQRRIEDERQAIQIGQQLRRIQEQGASARGASGVRGLNDAPGIRTLIARGGSLEQAETVANDLAIPLGEAIKGLAELRLLPQTMQASALAAATGAQRSGLVGFGDVIAKLVGTPLARRSVLGDDAGSPAQIARVVSAVTESSVGAGDVILGTNAVGRSRGVQQADQAQRLQNQNQMVDILRIVTGEAVEAVRRDLIANREPEAVAMSALHKELMANVDALRQMDAALNPVIRKLLLFTQDGGPGTQANRAARVMGGAIGADNQPPLGGR